ncbi:MAG: hypothetical protein SFV53_07025 [Rickettsiales bacterium]|nr:hypothetical protein [Rickettsiales bacterium]
MIPKINKNPYYIYSPHYRYTSAGIKALYLLSHHINSAGYNSFIVCDDETIFDKEYDELFYNLNIKFLNKDILAFHKKSSYNPIVIYSDTVKENPLGAKNVVRYMMNFSNLFIETKNDENDFVIAYSKVIAESLNLTQDRVLFIPTSNTDIFYPPTDSNSKREGTCVYMGKYYDFHKGSGTELTKNSRVITRIRGEFTPNQIADIFRKSELLYLYENSAMAIEAVLCGCPAVFIPNEFLKEQQINLSKNELGEDGYAISNNEESIKIAKNNVLKGRENYLSSFTTFETQLQNFIAKTQNIFVRDNSDNKEVIDWNFFDKIEKNKIDYNEKFYFDTIMSKRNFDDIIIFNKNNFDILVSCLKSIYPKKSFIKKIKVFDGNERLTIKYKVIVKFKTYNLGRSIKKIFKKNKNATVHN